MEFLNDMQTIVPLWVATSFAVVFAVYWYLTNTHSHWKKLGIPYVKPVPLLGTMAAIFKEPFHEVELKRYKEKGRVYGTFEGKKPTLTVAEPDVLRDILVKDFQFFNNRRSFKSGDPVLDKMVSNLQGEDWKRVRTLITPAFTTGRIKKMVSIIMDSAQTVTQNFRSAAEKGEPLEMKRYFGAFTMDVITSSAFGTKIDSHNDPENPFVANARQLFKNNITWRIILFFILPLAVLRKLRVGALNRMEIKFFQEVTLKIVEERKRIGHKRNDFLQLMIDAVKELEEDVEAADENDKAKDIGHEENNDQVLKQVYSTKTLSNDELVAQCVIFFLAGYDTTASTLSFAAYELALNPDVQDLVIAEIDEAIREKGELNYETISEMKYLDNVVSETLRKYPPASRLERIASEDYHIKGLDITVPKDMIVGVPVVAIHHDPEHYPDPEKFDPDRFTPEQKATRHPYTYLPFGAGPRNCIAMRFALMEVKVCLAYVLSQCRFVTCSQTTVPLEFNIGSGLMQPKEVMLKVDIRKNETKI